MYCCQRTNIISFIARELIKNFVAVLCSVLCNSVVFSGKIYRIGISVFVVHGKLSTRHVVINVIAQNKTPITRLYAIKKICIEHHAQAVVFILSLDFRNTILPLLPPLKFREIYILILLERDLALDKIFVCIGDLFGHLKASVHLVLFTQTPVKHPDKLRLVYLALAQRKRSLNHLRIILSRKALFFCARYSLVWVESAALTVAVPSVTDGYCIGGDARTSNYQNFKGTIYSVHLFSDVRSAEEIKRDAVMVQCNDNSLILSEYLEK